MRHFQQKINELGLEGSKLSKSTTLMIKDFKDAEIEFESLQQQLEDASEDEAESLQNQIEEYAALLEQTDHKIAARIQDYIDKKPYYDAKYKHMREKADEKARAKAAAMGNPAPAPAPSPSPSPAPSPAPAPAPSPEPVAASSEGDKDNGGGWLLWGVLGLAGLFVGVNLFKRRG